MTMDTDMPLADDEQEQRGTSVYLRGVLTGRLTVAEAAAIARKAGEDAVQLRDEASRQEAMHLATHEPLTDADLDRMESDANAAMDVDEETVAVLGGDPSPMIVHYIPALVAEVRRQRARIRQLEDIVQWALDEGGWRLIYYSDPPPHDLVDTSDMFGGSEVKRYDTALASAGDAGREGE